MICENVPAFPGINGWFINCRAKANVKTNMWSKSVNHSSMVSCGFPQGCITSLKGGGGEPGHFASSRDHDRNTSVNETCSTFSLQMVVDKFHSVLFNFICNCSYTVDTNNTIICCVNTIFCANILDYRNKAHSTRPGPCSSNIVPQLFMIKMC